MQVRLLHYTPLEVAATAIRKCWASEGKADTEHTAMEELWGTADENLGAALQLADIELGEADRKLIDRIGNKFKHASTLEHLSYNFDIDGISRACLQELARHRHASLSVKSTRYTLKELKELDEFRWTTKEEREAASKYIVLTDDYVVDAHNIRQLNIVAGAVKAGKSNDIVKYLIPEAYKTSLVWSVNARALQNFLQLRTNKAALWEIRELAYEIFKQLPEEHKYLFKDCLYKEK